MSVMCARLKAAEEASRRPEMPWSWNFRSRELMYRWGNGSSGGAESALNCSAILQPTQSEMTAEPGSTCGADVSFSGCALPLMAQRSLLPHHGSQHGSLPMATWFMAVAHPQNPPLASLIAHVIHRGWMAGR